MLNARLLPSGTVRKSSAASARCTARLAQGVWACVPHEQADDAPVQGLEPHHVRVEDLCEARTEEILLGRF